ncbi:DNA polymerase III subunit alpha [Bacillus suaedaesalsae]|uniref:DNA polymerase III subunit alpha n=1 Tax=Bacillus suaedaesalsae TaxID=2810349 RepID=A0ABS2DG72_9BACI|nr:DNA polymerase III subunit alpha [Bacillus suaedaesalsae]MBM6617480.1 DNA polymerase III subunit alpha [Bacillus suaedaesalsae]
MEFIHLQVKSAYSLLSSSCKIEELVQRGADLGFQALAITDVNNLYGAIPFYKACKAKGIKPIIGLTISVYQDEEQKVSYPLVLLARNNKGYKNLIKISSTALTMNRDAIVKKWLRAYSDGIIAISPGIKGEIEQLILQDEHKKAKAVALEYKQIFHNEFYFSIQNHGLQGENTIRNVLIEWNKSLGIELVATNDVHYIYKEDAFVQECLLAIKNGTKLSDMTREKLPSEEFFLKSKEQMGIQFKGYESALHNTKTIADKCNISIEFGQKLLPKYPVPSTKDAHVYLEELCHEGLRNRKLENTQYLERLSYELTIIKQMGFSDYFLIVWDFMKYAHDQGILTGPGRGSAAGSLVSFVLGITNVDPVPSNLLFERFLNPERISMPDIDIDFPDDRRDEMIQYVSQKYGAIHVAQIITFGTLSTKAVLRDVGRVLGVSPQESDAIARKVPSRLGITLSEAYQESQALRKHIDESTIIKKVFDVAQKLEGLPRHTSTHAAGVIISDIPLTDIVPIQDGGQGVYLTQYSMDILEEIGLLKMDFLGLRNLTILKRILEMISYEKKLTINLEDVPLDDQKTFSLLSKGDTTGVFQLESSGMRSVLKRLKPTHFEDIVAVNALYRPGPMENIPTYIENKQDPSKVTYLHPHLEEILKPTNGVIVYQEQIMQIASKMAGFSLGEADLLRRAVSKKKKDVLDSERKHFVDGCIRRGYNEAVAHEVYDLIVRFANYGFNRSHAVAYSLVAYHLAYLKANFPIFFMAALLTSVIGNEDKVAGYVRETKGKGIDVLPPSINKSHFAFLVQNGAIRFSLAAIKNVGAQTLRKISASRKEGPFQDLFEFCTRTSTNRKTLESLIFAGCFDEFKEERSTLIASIDVALDYAELVKPESEDQIDFSFDEELLLKPQYIQVEPLKAEDKLKFEKEAIGFYLSSHPTTAYEKYWRSYKPITIQDGAGSYLSKKVHIVALITNERTIRTKKGEQMSFLVISDESGEIEATVFPNKHREYFKILKAGNVVLLEGKFETRNNSVQFVVQNAKTMDELKETYVEQVLFIKIEPKYENSETLFTLKQLLSQHHGDTEVVMYYEENQKTIKLPKNFHVTPTEQCMSKIRDVIGEKNVVLKSR